MQQIQIPKHTPFKRKLIRGFGKNVFDFFGYDNASPYFSAENNKVISKMKEEIGVVLRRKFMELVSEDVLGFSSKIVKVK